MEGLSNFQKEKKKKISVQTAEQIGPREPYGKIEQDLSTFIILIFDVNYFLHKVLPTKKQNIHNLKMRKNFRTPENCPTHPTQAKIMIRPQGMA